RTAPLDPFFDRPYEPDPNASAVWDHCKPATPAPAAPVRILSPNIKAKKKVATLLGGKVPA
ncbi:MAG TPA: ATP-dependent helicase, partial [Ideonella sp.]|nr:ATP-dependent helicase [Ideonella sp.]